MMFSLEIRLRRLFFMERIYDFDPFLKYKQIKKLILNDFLLQLFKINPVNSILLVTKKSLFARENT